MGNTHLPYSARGKIHMTYDICRNTAYFPSRPVASSERTSCASDPRTRDELSLAPRWLSRFCRSAGVGLGLLIRIRGAQGEEGLVRGMGWPRQVRTRVGKSALAIVAFCQRL
eukprot:scaffold46275_cov38-Tisochrysis_lutea.AAC.1